MKENQELKKKKVKDNAMEFTEKLKKKEKQKKKDSKKKERNKKNVPTRVGKSCEIPNLKEVPGNCKHLVTLSMSYQVTVAAAPTVPLPSSFRMRFMVQP